MITTIIITALVSVFITLVIGYFIWQFISVRKLKKQVKDNSNNILGQSEWIKNLEDNTYKKFDQVYDDMSRSTEETHTVINKNDKKINDKLNEIVVEIYQKVNKEDDEIHRELDRRFEKVYQILSKKE